MHHQILGLDRAHALIKGLVTLAYGTCVTATIVAAPIKSNQSIYICDVQHTICVTCDGGVDDVKGVVCKYRSRVSATM